MAAETKTAKQIDDMDAWFIEFVHVSESIERLEYISEVIKQDVSDGMKYTKDPDYMNRLRRVWSDRYRAISTRNDAPTD